MSFGGYVGGTVQFPPAALEEFVRRDETQQGEKGSEWRANSGNVSGRNRQMDRRVDGQMAAVPSNVPSRGMQEKKALSSRGRGASALTAGGGAGFAALG